MKKLSIIVAAAMLSMAAAAQTLNVTTSDGVVWLFPSASAGDMTYTSGTSLTIMGKTFTLTDINKMAVDESTVTSGQVSVAYSGTTATITVAGDVAQYVTPIVSGAYVKMVQSTALTNDLIDAGTAPEVNYVLSGTSADGGFYMSGTAKATVTLSSLSLTNASGTNSGAAIHIEDGKRIDVKVVGTNTLTDYASGSQKGCLYVKGHAEFENEGTLTVSGKLKHGIKTGDYCEVNGPTINVTSAAGDGINCTEFFWMRSGSLTISGVGDDGIQCDIDNSDGTTTAASDSNHSDEDTGSIYIDGGTINASVTTAAAKALKAEGSVTVASGNIIATTSGGGAWDSTNKKTKASACIGADGNFSISGGTLTLTSSGAGGKGISVDGTLTTTGGTISIVTTGQAVAASSSGTLTTVSNSQTLDNYSSNYKSSPKGIKVDGNIDINGGTIEINTSGAGGEGIESKAVMNVTSGTLDIDSYDDGLNSSSHMYIKGGTITAVAADNDAIDSNGNLYIQGGTIIACGADGAECALDAAERYYLYITGGTVLAIAANNNSVTSTSGSQCVVDATFSSNISGGTTITVAPKNGSTIQTFTVPGSYNSSSRTVTRAGGFGGNGGGGNPGGGNGGGGTPGSGGSFGGGSSANVLISLPALTANTEYTITAGSSSTTAKASTTYSGK